MRRERRNFPRVPYRANAELETAGGRWPVQVIDLSFTGAMVVSTASTPPSGVDSVTLHITLNHETPITMRGHLAHANGSYLGLECMPTGVDHRSRLRRLFNRISR